MTDIYDCYSVLPMKTGDVVFWDTQNQRFEFETRETVHDRHGIYLGIIPPNIHPFDAFPFLQDHALRRIKMSLYSKNKGVSILERALIQVPQFAIRDGREILPFFFAAIPCTIYRVIDYETGETVSQPRIYERRKQRFKDKERVRGQRRRAEAKFKKRPVTSVFTRM